MVDNRYQPGQRRGTQQQTRTAERPAQQRDAFSRPPDQPPAVRQPDPTPTSNLPAGAIARGLDEPTWNTLCNSIFPGALADSILMAVDYCRARQLDILKKPCHIVGMRVQQKYMGTNGQVESRWVWRDVILPGIYEYRITARRTGEYLGHSTPEWGEPIKFGDELQNGSSPITAPEWCAMTIYRWNAELHKRIEYPVQIYFTEVVATRDLDGKTVANARWSKAPRQMLLKCTEAAGLREAFPDELGGEPTAEEMDGRTIDAETVPPQPRGKPATERPRATTQPNRETRAASTDTKAAPAETNRPAGETSRATEPDQAAQSSTGNQPADAPVDPETGEVRATTEQLQHIRRLLDKTGVTENGVCEKFDLGVLEDLGFDQVGHVVAWINNAV